MRRCLSACHARTRAHVRTFSSLPLPPFPPFSPPCVLYKFPDRAPTPRALERDRRGGTYFQNTLHVRSHGTLPEEEVSHAPASDSTLRFNFYVGLTSFLLTTFLSLSLIEYVLINHATLIRVAVDFLNELRMRWFFTRCYFTKKIIDKIHVNVRIMYSRETRN